MQTRHDTTIFGTRQCIYNLTFSFVQEILTDKELKDALVLYLPSIVCSLEAFLL